MEAKRDGNRLICDCGKVLGEFRNGRDLILNMADHVDPRTMEKTKANPAIGELSLQPGGGAPVYRCNCDSKFVELDLETIKGLEQLNDGGR